MSDAEQPSRAKDQSVRQKMPIHDLLLDGAYAQGAGHRREELTGRNHFALFPDAENQAISERGDA